MSKITNLKKSNFAVLDALSICNVEMKASFLQKRRIVNQEVSLNHQYEECERTGRIDNFKIAAGIKKGTISHHLAADSDVYKWIEACAYSLCTDNKQDLQGKVDSVISLIAQAQEDNGYINTSFLNKENRWQDLTNGHELYCGGHLIQAAVAYYRATGENNLLTVAIKWADLIFDIFITESREGTAGHPVIEMALIELYRETEEKKYLKLAQYFIEIRGKGFVSGRDYYQDHLSVREQTSMEGHAVRQLYLLAGITDLYSEIGDNSLLETLKKQWYNFTTKKMAITGGAGARYAGEAFGLDYELPNRTGYYETCAAIASFMWNWRMLKVTGEAKYADIMEQTLYNGLLSGVSLDGKKYFYTNPLEHDGQKDLALNYRGSNQRTSKHWEHTACCPPNMARLLSSLAGYIYGKSEKEIYIHHYLANKAHFKIKGSKVQILQNTNYPWSGDIELKITTEQETEFTLKLRIPAWAEEIDIKVNGKKINDKIVSGTYLVLKGKWLKDKIKIKFSMPVQKVVSHPRLSNNDAKVALKRGPVIYCLESGDHLGIDIYNISILKEEEFKAVYEKDLLSGIVVLKGKGFIRKSVNSLYMSITEQEVMEEKELTFVPYFSWANRKKGAMKIYYPVK